MLGLRRRLLEITEAPTLWQASQRIALYAALRTWGLIVNCFPIELNLASARLLGTMWWTLHRRGRELALANLRAAFAGEYTEPQLRAIALKAYQHWTQVYLVELVMTPRLVNRWSWSRYIELGELGPGLRELLRPDRPVIMVTPHFGNFELMGYTIAMLGMPMTAVMRPLDNPLITNYLKRSRAATGLSLLDKFGATDAFQEILGNNGTLCFIADQYGGARGVKLQFFGRDAMVYKSIALAAMMYKTPVIVGHAIRTRRGFHYRMEIERIIQPEEWADRDDALRWITVEYTAAFERAIRRAPEQYLWQHDRWKMRAKKSKKKRAPVTAPESPADSES